MTSWFRRKSLRHICLQPPVISPLFFGFQGLLIPRRAVMQRWVYCDSGLAGNHQKLGGCILPRAFGKSMALLTPWLQTSRPQNCKTVSFCCFKTLSVWYVLTAACVPLPGILFCKRATSLVHLPTEAFPSHFWFLLLCLFCLHGIYHSLAYIYCQSSSVRLQTPPRQRSLLSAVISKTLSYYTVRGRYLWANKWQMFWGGLFLRPCASSENTSSLGTLSEDESTSWS